MLVLSRKSLETIQIGDSIRVTVLQVRGDRVRLGVDAPSNVPVHREEVLEKLTAARPTVEPRSITTSPDVAIAAQGGKVDSTR